MPNLNAGNLANAETRPDSREPDARESTVYDIHYLVFIILFF
jgi:hypothetical protein